MKFIVAKEFFDKVPNAYFGVVVVKNFNNKKQYSFINEMLNESIIKCQKEYENVKVKESENIIPYREAFLNLGINPNKYLCSIEALLTRLSKGNSIPSINPIVDLGNALSIKYSLPIGAHDIDNFSTDSIEIRPAVETDEFVPFGSEEIETPEVGEIVYASGKDIKTRRWTWRQGEKSKITENTTNIFYPIDGFKDINEDKVKKLQSELVSILKDKLNLEVITGYVDKDHPVFEWK